MKKKLKLNPFAKKLSTIQKNYISQNWEQNKELIIHLCQFSQNLLLVIAPEGGGKSTFARYFLSFKTPQFHIILIEINEETNLNQCLNVFMEEDKIHVMLIDDAHLLTKEQIQMLNEFAYNNFETGKKIQLVLFGNPSLELRMLAIDFSTKQNQIYTIELEPWTKQDVYQYLVKECHSLLTLEQIETLWMKSKGIPKYVQEENIKFDKGWKKVSTAQHKRSSLYSMMVSALVGVLMGGSYLLYHGVTEEDKYGNPLNLAQHSEDWSRIELHSPKVDEMQYHPDNPVMDESSSEEGTTRSLAANMPIIDNALGTELNGNVGENETQTQFQPKIADLNNFPVKSEATLPLTAEEKHLLAVEKNHYTLQLLGTGKEESVKQFIQSYALKDKIHQFKTRREGKDWFVVVYGDYLSAKEAKAAVQTMPEKLRQAKLEPWVREIRDIQEDIQKR